MYNKSDSIIQKEKVLCEMQDSNPSDPQFFMALLDFCEHYLNWQKLQFKEHIKEEIYTEFAEDLFLRINSKGPLNYNNTNHPFIWYLNACKKSMLKKYYSSVGSSYVQVSPESTEEMFVQFCEPTQLTDDLNRIELFDYINVIPSVVIDVLNESKYYCDTLEYFNTRTSLLCSLLVGEYTPYNQSITEQMYGRMLYQRLSDVIMESLKDSIVSYNLKFPLKEDISEYYDED